MVLNRKEALIKEVELANDAKSIRVSYKIAIVASLVLMFFVALTIAPSPLPTSSNLRESSLFIIELNSPSSKPYHPEQVDITNEVPCGVATSTKQLNDASNARNISDFARIVKRPEDNFVTVTFASYSYRDALINWMLTAERAKIRSVVVVCLDDQLQEYLYERGVPCFHAYAGHNEEENEKITPMNDKSDVYDEVEGSYDEATNSNNKEHAHVVHEAPSQLSQETIHDLWVMRVSLLSQIIHSGMDVLFSDLDVVILQDPRPLFEKAEVVASRGKFPSEVRVSWGSTVCMGFAYFKSTPNVKDLLEKMVEMTKTRHDDQVAVNYVLRDILGEDPEKVWGRRSSSRDPKHAVSQISGKIKVVILSAYSLPRFCNLLSPKDWNSDVIAAHCRPNSFMRVDSVDKGSEMNRDIAMERYQLFCDTDALQGKRAGGWFTVGKGRSERMRFVDPDPSVMLIAAQTPTGRKAFAEWLSSHSKTCDFASFASKPGTRDFFS